MAHYIKHLRLGDLPSLRGSWIRDERPTTCLHTLAGILTRLPALQRLDLCDFHIKVETHSASPPLLTLRLDKLTMHDVGAPTAPMLGIADFLGYFSEIRHLQIGRLYSTISWFKLDDFVQALTEYEASRASVPLKVHTLEYSSTVCYSTEHALRMLGSILSAASTTHLAVNFHNWETWRGFGHFLLAHPGVRHLDLDLSDFLSRNPNADVLNLNNCGKLASINLDIKILGHGNEAQRNNQAAIQAVLGILSTTSTESLTFITIDIRLSSCMVDDFTSAMDWPRLIQVLDRHQNLERAALVFEGDMFTLQETVFKCVQVVNSHPQHQQLQRVKLAAYIGEAAAIPTTYLGV
ncbi:unnamed protein product [Somion occarium]|uniref:Uncharacterized protein n=1 Tax=Somion occarium TaxID=3059160 RepID=A0ABP1CQY5_9APHY